MRNINTERKLMLFNTLYEREVPSMSKAKSLKNGNVSSDTPLKNSRSLMKGKNK